MDDNPTNLEVLRVRLGAQGYELVTAVDGEDALAKVREFEPDLVLLDVMMPKLDGISVVKQLKQDNQLRFIPVILVTAKADTRDVVAGLEAGGDDYLTKPVEQSALVARVKSLLRIKELHDKVQAQAAQLQEQTEQLSSWNQLLEKRVTDQTARDRPNEPPAAVLGAASRQDDRVLGCARNAVEQPSARRTVVFCDLRGFTAFTESTEPEE